MIDKLRQISFSEPQWFLLLLVIPLLIYVHYKFLRNLTSGMFINASKSEFADQKFTLSPIDYLLLIRVLAIVFVIAALANPQILTRIKIKSPASETNIVFALDVSKSMLIEDIKPSRIEALKDVLNSFVAMRSQDPMGIVLYAGEKMNWCPLTKNYPLLLSRINKIEDNDLSDGTAIGEGLASAINVLKQSAKNNRVIILLTDGENNAGAIDPFVAAGFAKRYNIKIYAVGIGSTGFANFPLIGIDGKKFYQRIFVRLNVDALKKIANLSGGEYYKASDAKSLQNIYAAINKKETKDIKWITKVNYSTCFDWFVDAALIVLLLEVLLRFTILNTWPA
jgi:Ca-activated chloride channel family protein